MKMIFAAVAIALMTTSSFAASPKAVLSVFEEVQEHGEKDFAPSETRTLIVQDNSLVYTYQAYTDGTLYVARKVPGCADGADNLYVYITDANSDGQIDSETEVKYRLSKFRCEGSSAPLNSLPQEKLQAVFDAGIDLMSTAAQ